MQDEPFLPFSFVLLSSFCLSSSLFQFCRLLSFFPSPPIIFFQVPVLSASSHLPFFFICSFLSEFYTSPSFSLFLFPSSSFLISFVLHFSLLLLSMPKSPFPLSFSPLIISFFHYLFLLLLPLLLFFSRFLFFFLFFCCFFFFVNPFFFRFPPTFSFFSCSSLQISEAHWRMLDILITRINR